MLLAGEIDTHNVDIVSNNIGMHGTQDICQPPTHDRQRNPKKTVATWPIGLFSKLSHASGNDFSMTRILLALIAGLLAATH